MNLVVTDTAYRNRGFIKRFKLDMAFGSDENDFLLTVPCSTKIELGSLIYVPGTEYGGIVREPYVIREEGLTYRQYHGQTWHGLMDERVLYPDNGVDYLTVSGDSSTIIQNLINRVGLQSLFQAAPSIGINIPTHRFDHDSSYLYGGLMKMLEKVGCILNISRTTTGKTIVGAIPTPTHIDDSRTSKMGMTAKKFHPINHLVCLGKGQLKDRLKVDLYADKNGNVSQTQTIFGIDVREQIYDLSSGTTETEEEPPTDEDRKDLIENGTKYLKDLQVFTEAEIEIPEGTDYRIGSIVTRKEARAGISITAKVDKVVVKLYSNGEKSIDATLSDESITWKEN